MSKLIRCLHCGGQLKIGVGQDKNILVEKAAPPDSRKTEDDIIDELLSGADPDDEDGDDGDDEK